MRVDGYPVNGAELSSSFCKQKDGAAPRGPKKHYESGAVAFGTAVATCKHQNKNFMLGLSFWQQRCHKNTPE
jgi:hypothetical protein